MDMSTPARQLHQAGPWINRQQHCARCGILLADGPLDGSRSKTGHWIAYPLGSIIEQAPTYQSVLLTVDEPTCTPKAVAV